MSGADTLKEVIVPFEPQDEGDECVIACCLMVLKWARNRFGDGIPLFSYEAVKGILQKDIGRDGIALDAPKRLTKSRELQKSIPRLNFPYSFSTGLAEIEKEIRKEYPIITWLHQTINGKPRNHSVVVVGLSKDKMTIKYLDPLNDAEPLSVATPKFLEEWKGTLNAQIRIHIPEDPLKYLPDYLDEMEDDNK